MTDWNQITLFDFSNRLICALKLNRCVQFLCVLRLEKFAGDSTAPI